MSDTDSFIEEVTEEVRRDRLFKLVRRYGWMAILAVVILVGGAAWNEWRKAEERSIARAFGDAILASFEQPDRATRAAALSEVEAPTVGGQAILTLLTAAEESTENPADAAARLLALADGADVPQVYRQLATLKAVTIEGAGMSVEDRRTRMEGLVLAGGVVRLLAEEQIALIEIETGESGAAVERFQRIIEDAEATAGLRQRAGQLIVALGEQPAG